MSNKRRGRESKYTDEGNDLIVVGPGENIITGGDGRVSYTIDYGGLCRITDWTVEDTLNLSSWPAQPDIFETPAGMQIRLGVSVILLEGITDRDGVLKSVMLEAPKD